MNRKTRVTVWNEFLCENEPGPVRELYPQGIHQAIAAGIAGLGDFEIQFAWLNQPDHGLTEQRLAETDVLVWWGHRAHHLVDDSIVDRVHQQVLRGMGLIVLHSAHFSKIFIRLMGTDCRLKWRDRGEVEKIWNLQPSHPILRGIPDFIQIDQEEMYGEPFDIPRPDELLMVSWFAGGEVFRSLCTWRRGLGQVIYFRPGHETFPSFHHPDILRVIANSCSYACRPVLCIVQEPNPGQSRPIPANPGQSRPIPANPGQSRPIPPNPAQSLLVTSDSRSRIAAGNFRSASDGNPIDAPIDHSAPVTGGFDQDHAGMLSPERPLADGHPKN